jgi:trehalose 6-phosphate phosphatase
VQDVDATIAALTADPAATAFLTDFDGSLSPIVEHAGDAQPLRGALEQLARLAPRLGRVAVVSGRPVDFLVAHVPVPGVLFVGHYGMEQMVDGERRVDGRVEPYLDAVAAAIDDLAGYGSPFVEVKSGLSVTLHWRPAPEREAELTALAQRVADRHGLATLRTRMAIEVRPPVDLDKGTAVRELVQGFAVGAFAGDDTGDLPAFAALAHAGLDRAVRIGVHSPEAPPALVEAVDILVDGPAGLVALLGRVADEIA